MKTPVKQKTHNANNNHNADDTETIDDNTSWYFKDLEFVDETDDNIHDNKRWYFNVS